MKRTILCVTLIFLLKFRGKHEFWPFFLPAGPLCAARWNDTETSALNSGEPRVYREPARLPRQPSFTRTSRLFTGGLGTLAKVVELNKNSLFCILNNYFYLMPTRPTITYDNTYTHIWICNDSNGGCMNTYLYVIIYNYFQDVSRLKKWLFSRFFWYFYTFTTFRSFHGSRP